MKNQMLYGLSVLAGAIMAGAMLTGAMLTGAIMAGWRPGEPWHPKAHRRNALRRRFAAPEAAAPEAMAGPSAGIGEILSAGSRAKLPGQSFPGKASRAKFPGQGDVWECVGAWLLGAR